MEQELPITVVEDINGNKYYLDSVLGQGGQGMVCRTKDSSLAVKFLMNGSTIIEDEKIYNKFESIIDDVVIMRFENDIRLCKPEIMLKKPMCGYVMKLLSDLKPVNKLIYAPDSDGDYSSYWKKTNGLKKRLEVLLELSRTLARLHSKGYVYCDISPNNVFYSDTANFSNVWLIDCDNIKYQGDSKKSIFTPGYGAPEVEKGITSNTTYSDCYSFAVLAFRMLTSQNPFNIDYNDDSSSEGWDASTTSNSTENITSEKWVFDTNLDEEKKVYFYHFIDSNLLELFNSTFGEKSILDPTSRPSMRIWYDALKAVILKLNKCSCGQFIYSSEEQCPFCNTKRNFKQFINVYNIYKKDNVARLVDEVNQDIKSDELDDADFVDYQLDTFKKNVTEMRLSNSIIVYDGLKIYDSSIFDVTICETPKLLFEFRYNNNNLFVTNKYSETVIIRIQGETHKLRSDESMPLTISNKETAQIYLNDPVSKQLISVNVKSL